MIERIFTPFFTTKPFGEGTGLGLDLAWRIVVEKHHGDLRVESEPGNTRFIVCCRWWSHARRDDAECVRGRNRNWQPESSGSMTTGRRSP